MVGSLAHFKLKQDIDRLNKGIACTKLKLYIHIACVAYISVIWYFGSMMNKQQNSENHSTYHKIMFFIGEIYIGTWKQNRILTEQKSDLGTAQLSRE